MTVYTRRRTPIWALVILSPFWVVWFTFVILWYTAVWSWRALAWAGVLVWGLLVRWTRTGTRT